MEIFLISFTQCTCIRDTVTGTGKPWLNVRGGSQKENSVARHLRPPLRCVSEKKVMKISPDPLPFTASKLLPPVEIDLPKIYSITLIACSSVSNRKKGRERLQIGFQITIALEVNSKISLSLVRLLLFALVCGVKN